MSDHLNWSAVASYCSMGIKVFPIAWQSKTPLLATDWKALATNDVVAARKIFPADDHWNIGISLGPDSNVCDIETDSEESAAALAEAFEMYGEEKTVAYRSNRGIHRWYQWSARLSTFGKSVLKWKGVECRLGTGDRGAYSVVPPSLHESGQTFYEWLPGCAPWEVPISRMPGWLEELYALNQDSFESKSVIEVSRQGDDLMPAPGQRHQYLIGTGNLLAGSLRLPHEVAYKCLMIIAEATGKVADNGLEKTQKECWDIVRTAQRSHLPQEDIASIDFSSMYDQAKELGATLREDQAYVPPAPGIPAHVMHPFLEEFSRRAHNAHYSRDLTIMSMLGTCSAAMGNAVTVQFSPHSDPLGLQMYSLGVAGASVGKSRVVNKFTAPVCVGEAYCTDATSASMVNALHVNPRGVLLKVTEGKGLTKMLGKYIQSDGTDQNSDNEVFLLAWSGELMKILRKSGNMEIDHPFLSIVAATQQYGLNAFNIDDTLNGLMQRFFIYPSPLVPPRINEEDLKWVQDNMRTYTKIVERLKSIRATMSAPVVPTEDGQTTAHCAQPCAFILNKEAREKWMEYQEGKRDPANLNEWPDGHPFQAEMMRHAEQVLRVAATFHGIDLAYCDKLWEGSHIHIATQIWIPKETVQRAIDFVEYMFACKQDLMGDIAEDRFHKANPLGAKMVASNLAEHMDKFVAQRRKKLERALQNSNPWTMREYYRFLGLQQPVAEFEVETMLKTRHVVHAGVRNKVNVFAFVEKRDEGQSR